MPGITTIRRLPPDRLRQGFGESAGASTKAEDRDRRTTRCYLYSGAVDPEIRDEEPR
jgi:hypothetical protein